ncbi:hypothetical protein [Sphingomonas sp.]|uniref:hypothetical protein n=1 Tax=Sphingomonas sp. TaxID=28214 RepID=UPI001EB7EB33|nr:hypothetical protein [Sphingomonas sp.]MBX3593282.1 hypothetical protein [Sphingomonas sp.]
MAAVIVDVIQIASADRWYTGHEWSTTSERDPIAYFALVQAFDPEFPNLAPVKQTIAVSAGDALDELVGRNISDFPSAITHESRIID